MLWKFSNLVERVFPYRAFSLTWPAAMQIYWNKRRRLHKKRVQIPQDWFGTPTWPPFHCLGHQYGRRDVMWKHSIPMYLAKYEHAGATFFLSVLRAMWSRFASPCEMRARALFCNVWNAKQQETQGKHRIPKMFKNCVYQIYSSPLLFYLSYRKMGKTELSSPLLRSTRRCLWGVCI